MEKEQRVPKGEKYFYVNEIGNVSEWPDTGGEFATMHFFSGNYFPDRESAEAMAEKLRAVLKGADVIEMPSEEEIKERLDMIIPHNPCAPFVVEGICKHLVGWLKSKKVM